MNEDWKTIVFTGEAAFNCGNKRRMVRAIIANSIFHNF
jgi:hypothetical protein